LRNCAGVVIAVDTNVLVRLLTGDDPAQFARARKLFETETIFLSKTVVLETEWVLRRLYGLSAREIAKALSALVALPQVRSEDASTIVEALEFSRRGVDFADALHLASSRTAERFATFDRSLIRRARASATHIVVASP
jgi:predicted nucleic-acid-binding protein